MHNLVLCRGNRYIWITLLKRGEEIGFERPDFDENAAPAFNCFDHPVNVRMTDATYRELDRVARRRILHEREHFRSCLCWRD